MIITSANVFLLTEISFENLTFWMEVEAFHKITNVERLNIVAFQIFIKYPSCIYELVYNRYFGRGSEYELNIPDLVKSKIRDNLNKPDTHIFDEAQKVILSLMAEDIYPKFLASPRFQQLQSERFTSSDP